jgi:dihydroorotase-like cyclic amidohydrolase
MDTAANREPGRYSTMKTSDSQFTAAADTENQEATRENMGAKEIHRKAFAAEAVAKRNNKRKREAYTVYSAGAAILPQGLNLDALRAFRRRLHAGENGEEKGRWSRPSARCAIAPRRDSPHKQPLKHGERRVGVF